MSTDVLSRVDYIAEETDAGDAFTNSVLVSLLLLALPIKNSAYIIPPLFVGMQFLAGNIRFVERTFFWGCLAVFISAVSIIVDSLSGQQVNAPGLIVSVLTFAQLAVILSLRSNFSLSPTNWERLKTAVSYFVIIQSALGLMQYAACGDPDAVCGTLGLLDFRSGTFGMGQACLTFNLFAMIMFLFTDMKGVLPKVAIVAGLSACAVAHSGHQTVFAIVSVAFVGVMGARLAQFIKLAAALLVLLAVTAAISTVYWTDVEYWYEKVTQDENAPKRIATLSAVQIVSSPKNLMLGVGMGQFGSRAALITSDDYLPFPIPSVLVGESQYFREVIAPAIELFRDQLEGSVMSKPYSSAMNLVVECGIPLTLLLLIGVISQFLKNRRLSRSLDKHIQVVGVFSNVGLIFLVLCCFIENYLELPQAVFLPSLLYVAAHAAKDSNANQTDERDAVARVETENGSR